MGKVFITNLFVGISGLEIFVHKTHTFHCTLYVIYTDINEFSRFELDSTKIISDFDRSVCG